MRSAGSYGRWIALTLLTTLGGCGKSDDSAATATTEPATTAPAASSTDRYATTQPAAGSPSTVIPASAAQPVVQADPIIVLYTSVGDLYVRLYEKQAPRTVANFLSYVRGGFYDGTIFHQVEPGFVAMGGGYDQQKRAKPTRYPVQNEAANGLKNVRGSLAMAHGQDPQSAASEFFFNLADNPKLDHRGTAAEEFGYCVFGQVIDGLDVLDKLTSAAGQTVVIQTVKVIVMPRDDQVKPASNQSSLHRSRSPRACKCDDCLVSGLDPRDKSFYVAGGR